MVVETTLKQSRI